MNPNRFSDVLIKDSTLEITCMYEECASSPRKLSSLLGFALFDIILAKENDTNNYGKSGNCSALGLTIISSA